MLRVDVDGAAHAVFRDDGGVVRAGGPAFVLSVLVEAGDRVAEGDPLAVVESMKMENTITAPFGGTIAAVEAAANVQVEAGAPIVRIATPEIDEGPAAGAVDIAGTGSRTAWRRLLRAGIRRAAQLPARLRPRPRLGADDAEHAARAQPDRGAGRHRSDAMRRRAAGSVRRRQFAVPAARRNRSRNGAAHRQHPGVPAVLFAVAGRGSGGTAGLVPPAAGAGAAALRCARTGPHPRTRGSGRLDVPLFPPGRRARAGGYRHPRAPAAPPRQAGPAGRPRDAGPA